MIPPHILVRADTLINIDETEAIGRAIELMIYSKSNPALFFYEPMKLFPETL
jgi:hypothetical protein